MSTTADTQAPFLRTLAPLLRGLERQLRSWLDARRHFPVPIVARAEIEGLSGDLKRKSDALDVEKPLLIVMFMGGTGVGKSSLLNALAGAPVAQASFTRPTTRDPVVYFHHSINPNRLDPALRLCRLVQHNRDELEQKVLVDTPDLDSNDTENREKLIELLPIADVVLYVGSQEKYHDRLGWELFKEQRQRRAFAFVLNKWDRCVDAAAGLRPDDDLLRDLKSEGFENPRLFRTCAQNWIDAKGTTPTDLPPGEQFAELRNWLERGLTRLEVEAVKARGVSQLLAQLSDSLKQVRPPDLSSEAGKVRDAWNRQLAEESSAQCDALLGTLEPYQNEIEHHFSVRGQQRFRGLMAGYLRLTTRMLYFGSSLRDKIPSVSRFTSKSTPADEWDLTAFAHASAHVTRERVLTPRMNALANRLLVEADQRGFPLQLLNDRTHETIRLDWEERVTRSLVDALTEVEREAAGPTGSRRILRGAVTFLGNVLPGTVLVSSIIWLLWLFFVEQIVPNSLIHVLLPVYTTLAVLVVLHVVILFVLPVRWPAIREEFRDRLTLKLEAELDRVFLPIPTDVANLVTGEKRQTEHLMSETATVADWLREREQSAQISELYGR